MAEAKPAGSCPKCATRVHREPRPSRSEGAPAGRSESDALTTPLPKPNPAPTPLPEPNPAPAPLPGPNPTLLPRPIANLCSPVRSGLRQTKPSVRMPKPSRGLAQAPIKSDHPA